VPDIEELCTLCEPMPIDEEQDIHPVTSYPMKVERKKQREELDITNVVEWRHGLDRWFLLVRRPEGGAYLLLSCTGSRLDQISLPRSPRWAARVPYVPKRVCVDFTGRSEEDPLLSVSTMLRRPPADLPKTQKPSDDDCRIVKIQCVGDVVHVFSHIRKTYRVQWWY